MTSPRGVAWLQILLLAGFARNRRHASHPVPSPLGGYNDPVFGGQLRTGFDTSIA